MKMYEHTLSFWRAIVDFTNFNKYQFRMNMKEIQQEIKAYLEHPPKNPRPIQDEEIHFVYLLTYLGQLCIQGYRIIEQFDNIIIFSLMEFQLSEQLTAPQKRNTMKLPSKFKAVLWQYDEKNIHDIAAYRRSIFARMAQVSLFFGQIEYNIVYLHTFKYSIMTRKEIERATLPQCKNYFQKIQWIQRTSAYKPLQEKDQGIELHKLAQHFIKGAGEARNLEIIKRMQTKNRFCYDLFYVINTICYVIGKQMLENDYQTISAEKWMRYTTQKKFKRYDLLLRNQDKSGIIDWKFSKLEASQKIKGNGVHTKNKVYYQLAHKDFRTNAELKFYCFHSRVFLKVYHYITCASYFHKKVQEEIDKIDVIDISGDESQNQNQRDVSNKNGKGLQDIVLQSSSLEANLERSRINEDNVINIDGDEIESKSTQKENKSVKSKKDQKECQKEQINRQFQQINQSIIDNNAANKILKSPEQIQLSSEELNQEQLRSILQNPQRNMKKCEIKKKKYEEKFIDLTFERKQGIHIHVIDID